jgi:hypothetical protein
MLVETSDIVKKRIAAGKTLDQIKADGLPPEWKSWDGGFINANRWLETLYNSFTKTKP